MYKEVKYLISKKGTQDVECVANVSQGNNNETVLMSIHDNLDKAVKFDNLKDALKELQRKREFWNKNFGRCALYFYDSKTTPDDLGVLRITFIIEECN